MAVIETLGFVCESEIDTEIVRSKLNDMFMVQDMKPTTYIEKRKQSGSPIPCKKVPFSGGRGYKLLYTARNVIESAIEDGYEVKPSELKAITQDIASLEYQRGVLRRQVLELQEKEKALKENIAYMTGDLSCLSPMLKQTEFSLVPKSEIIKKAKLYEQSCGVYFLIKDDEIIYIGQSINIAHRIASHRDKDFDSMAFIGCLKTDLDVLESLYILAYRPKLNGSLGNSDIPSTPLSLRMIINRCKNTDKEV